MRLHPRLTAEGVLLARRAERFRATAERDGRGWVVGYGHRASAREGAQVTEADATALLAYDLSQSAGRVEPLLARKVSPELFDALNAYAFRLDPQAFARSGLLRRVNAGEAVTPAQAAAEPAPSDEPATSAVVLAAQAVRDRLAQVLTEPEPPPPRAAREPWREPPAAPHVPDSFPPEPEELVSDFEAATVGPRTEDEPGPVDAAPPTSWPDADLDEPPPPPFVSVAPVHAAEAATTPGAAPFEGEASPAALDEPAPPQAAFPEGASFPTSPPAPVVSFERGGRADLWTRVRANPNVYMAVGACGLVLFACALLGFLMGRPTGLGFAVGVVGVVCMAPALAFFLHRRHGG